MINKIDGNSIGIPTPIWANQVSDDGLSLVGEKVELLSNNPNSWEGPLIEGPWVIKTGGYYYLFYSANGYATDKVVVVLLLFIVIIISTLLELLEQHPF